MADQVMTIREHVAGYLEVGANEKGEVIVNHPQLEVDAQGRGFIAFSPYQAKQFAAHLLRLAKETAALSVQIDMDSVEFLAYDSAKADRELGIETPNEPVTSTMVRGVASLDGIQKAFAFTVKEHPMSIDRVDPIWFEFLRKQIVQSVWKTRDEAANAKPAEVQADGGV